MGIIKDRSTKNIILISVGFVAFIVFLLEAVISVVRMKQDTENLNEALLLSTTVKEAQYLDAQMGRISQEARVLALLIGSDEDRNTEDYDAFIRKNIVGKPFVFGMGYWFEPFAFDENEEFYGPYIYKEDDGNIVKTMIYSTQEYNYFSWDWYNNSILSDQLTVYSAPFYDPNLDTVFITASVKIIDDITEAQLGVVSIDITLREVTDYLSTFNEKNGTNSFIITNQGYYWGRSDSNQTNLEQNILSDDDPFLRVLGGRVLSDETSGSLRLEDKVYVWAPIGDTGLRFITVFSKEVIAKGVYQSIFEDGLTFLVAVAFFIVFLNQILKRRIERPLAEIIQENHFNENLSDYGVEKAIGSFDDMVQLIDQLMAERARYIDRLNENNDELLIKNEEIEALYNQAAAMNETLHRLLNEVKEGYLVTVRSLSNAIEAKDRYTKGHCENVTFYAVETAKLMHLPEEDYVVLEYAGLLHDVGKIGIPSTILNKPDKLTQDEFEIIMSHPAIGFEILKDIDFLNRTAMIVYEHHEKVDGSGYPRGLNGEEMDILTKIIAVADAFDAMTSARPYRLDPLSFEIALGILKDGVGTQFDGEVVCVFEQMLDNLKKDT